MNVYKQQKKTFEGKKCEIYNSSGIFIWLNIESKPQVLSYLLHNK